MREKELLKIALQGDFNVIKISKNEEGFYILKQMCACQIPSWCLLRSHLNSQILNFVYPLCAIHPSIFLMQVNGLRCLIS